MQKLLFAYYHSENRTTSQIWKVLPNMVFSPDLGGKNGGVLSMCMQVVLDSSLARPGSAPIWGGKKGEFRDWTTIRYVELYNDLGTKLKKIPLNFAAGPQDLTSTSMIGPA